MGVPNLDEGTIERADLDGQNRKTLVPEGATFTPKQLHLDKKNGKLYWSDREGMRVMRSNLDGFERRNLVQTGQGEVDRRDQSQMVRGHHRRSGTPARLLDAKGPGQRGARSRLSRGP